MPRIVDLLHADRTFKLMDAGLSFKEAAKLDRESAELMIEAWEIAMTCTCGNCDSDGDGDSGIVVYIGHPE